MTEDKPKFVPVDLTEMQNAGVLMAVNERVLWPLGLALTWKHSEAGEASDLHIREWQWEDGHHETIENSNDSITQWRLKAFEGYVLARIATMPEKEGLRANRLLGRKRITP
jgi:hypothetical protein